MGPGPTIERSDISKRKQGIVPYLNIFNDALIAGVMARADLCRWVCIWHDMGDDAPFRVRHRKRGD